jgi:protein O-mannosyl-transferase
MSAALFARVSRSELAWLGAIIVLLFLVYLPGLNNDPVFDDEYLVSGAMLSEYASLLPLKVRTLAYSSYVWVQAILGDGWWKQRLVNLVIHIGTTLALWGFYREVLRHITPSEGSDVPYERSPALGLGLGFFALNPVAVYAVAYLVQRSILLATFFVVLSLFFFARALSRKQPLLHIAAVACYALAVASKEHAVLTPLAAVPVYILVARPGLRRLAIVIGAGGVLVAIAAFLLSARYGNILGTPFDEYSRAYIAQLSRLAPDAEKNAYGLSIINQAYLFFHYGLRWLFPYEGWLSINLRPPFPIKFATFPHVLGIVGYIGVVLGGFYLLLRYRTWQALLGLSILLPALLFATEFATVWVQDPFVLYRSYLWAIGIPGFVFLLVHGPSPRVVAAIGAIVGVLLVWQTLDRVFSMGNEEKVWSDAIAKLPRDERSVGRWFPYLNRGSAYVDRQQYELAVRDFEASDALGDLGMGAANTGSVLSLMGRHRQALAALDRAEKKGYKGFNLPFQRGLALAALGRPAEAYAQFEIALSMNPTSPTREQALLHLARIGMQLQKREESIGALQEFLKKEPNHREARYLLGMGYVMRQDYPRAKEVLDKLIAEDANRRAFYARALAHYGLKRKAEALSDIERAIQAGGDDPHLREWHARIRAMP